MRRLYALLPVISLAVLGMLSCDDEKEITNEDTKEEAIEEKPSVLQTETLDSVKGTFFVASLSGRAISLDSVVVDYEYGIEYSSDQAFADSCTVSIKAENKDTTGTYLVTILGVEPGAEYYYRAYAVYDDEAYYGEVKTFTFEWTPPTVTTLSAEQYDSANVAYVFFKGLVKDKDTLVKDLSDYYPYGYYGVEYSTSEDFDEDSTIILYAVRSTDNMENDSVICTTTQFNFITTYYYRTFFRLGCIESLGEVKSFKFYIPVGDAIDLGLSVKWASFNVGADKPEGLGYHYAWGETQTKTKFSWSTYKYCNGSENTLTKYNTNRSYGIVDNKTTLDPEDDAAHVNWGGDWRIPTKAEFVELYDFNNCDWVWTTRNGMDGFLVTSKKKDYEDAFIFLPAATYRYDMVFEGIGERGWYWFSSGAPLVDCPYSAENLLMCLSLQAVYIFMERDYGLTIRPVCP